MGAGSTALIWYGLCCAAVAFTVIVASGLIAYGNRETARKRRERASLAGDTQSPEEPPRADESGPSDAS